MTTGGFYTRIKNLDRFADSFVETERRPTFGFDRTLESAMNAHELSPVRPLDVLPLVVGLLAIVVAAQAPSVAFADDLPPHKLAMEASASHQKLLFDQSQEIYAVVDVDALVTEVEDRPSMNLALVIDRSGSMRGSRIKQARNAALRVVESLSADDRLALVTFGADEDVVFDSTPVNSLHRDRMKSAIRNISPGGMTNLSAGYKTGVDLVRQQRNDRTAVDDDDGFKILNVNNHRDGGSDAPDDEETIDRVILLSDGKANRGITDQDTLKDLSRRAFDDDISTSTIGFGLDYNEQLMTAMAVEGAGNYYFADDTDDLSAIVHTEVNDLSATVANGVEVTIDPGDGVEIVDIPGFNHRYRNGKVVVGLSELAAGQNRSMVVQLQATPRDFETFTLATVRANYRDVENDRHRFRRTTLRAAITEVPEEVERHVDPDVMARVEEVRLASAIDDAMELYSSGDRQEARSLLRRESDRSQQTQQEYGFQSDRLDELEATYQRLDRTVEAEPADSDESRRIQLDSSSGGFETLRSR